VVVGGLLSGLSSVFFGALLVLVGWVCICMSRWLAAGDRWYFTDRPDSDPFTGFWKVRLWMVRATGAVVIVVGLGTVVSGFRTS